MEVFRGFIFNIVGLIAPTESQQSVTFRLKKCACANTVKISPSGTIEQIERYTEYCGRKAILILTKDTQSIN